MPIEVSRYRESVFRTIDITVTCKDKETGREWVEELHPKYRPITQQWVDEWEAIERRFNQTIARQSEDAVESAYDALTTIIELNTNGHTPQTVQEKAVFIGTLYGIVAEKVTLTDEQKEERKRLVSSQLATILIDVDMLDNGEPARPTPDFLFTLDFEFLFAVGANILKKTYQGRTS